MLSPKDKDAETKKKTILSYITNEMRKASVDESILEQLESLENILIPEGSGVTNAMAKAYSAVAFECTAKYLLWPDKKKSMYVDALRRIWLTRVMSLCDRDSQLVIPELKERGDELKAALLDESVRQRLREANTRNNALILLGEFVSEQQKLMGSWFNDSPGETSVRRVDEGDESLDGRKEKQPANREENSEGIGVRVDKGKKKVMGFDSGPLRDGVKVRVKREVKEMGPDSGAVHTINDSEEDIGQPEKLQKVDNENNDDIGEGQIRKGGCKRHRGRVELCDVEESDAQPSFGRCPSVPTPEFNRVLAELKASKLELLAAVIDPLPDALRVAKDLLSQMDKENMKNETQSLKQKDISGSDPAKPAQKESELSADPGQKEPDNENDIAEPVHQNNAQNRSLMERNVTACTFEWEDSIDDRPEEPSTGSRLHLSRPERVSASQSQLGTHQPPKHHSKKRNYWSEENAAFLAECVARHGTRWALIKRTYPEVFAWRTEVDLKDKWRNMQKRN